MSKPVLAFRAGELVQIVSLNLMGVIGKIWQGEDELVSVKQDGERL